MTPRWRPYLDIQTVQSRGFFERGIPRYATQLSLELLGDDAQVLDGDGYWQFQQLRSRGNTIEAGTSEILRNIIAERVLGLPRSR